MQADWDRQYEERIEVIESKLFVALKDGTLKAFGRPVSVKREDYDVWDMADEHEEIPASFWRLNTIDWLQSASKNEKGHYCHIYVNTEQLFALFPPPMQEEAKAVSLIAGQYILGESQAPKSLKMGQRGRPALDWDSFNLELTDRLMRGNMPKKQEAFINEMQNWCRENWGFEPGRSTILQKISPYYKKYVRN
ncbi:MAG: hypothetical protein ACT4OY_06075 [Alphaproteobacteria bacterium]